ncbi:HET-domain-containing protein, partial [Setomelanomma holmii]
MNLIPKTIHDAIIFTRKLGVHFLWADSLCIIQGDVEDWNRQSSMMADVYGGAWLTIAASWGVSMQDGIFLSRPIGSIDVPE